MEHNQVDVIEIFKRLVRSGSENEVVEFKQAKNSFDFTKLGRYFSALSNEANLNRAPEAYLVFGIANDKTLVGSNFRKSSQALHNLKQEIAEKTTDGITFLEIHPFYHKDKRIIVFRIPPAPVGIPIAFEGHYYARNNESLAPLNIEKIERIRSQVIMHDWTAEIVKGADLNDLDEQAIEFAKEKFLQKFSGKEKEIEDWDTLTFLNKAKITRKGKITRAAIILLGKPESEHFLNPVECKVRWILRDQEGNQLDYELFSCPLILNVNHLYSRIRNLKYRYIRDKSLFPEEVNQYEPFTIREAINNCIAHQDYTQGGRINVVEYPDHLVFTNKGRFLPVSVEEVVINDAPEETYRNPFLATAMFNIGMVDTAGGGIRKMFLNQAQKYFPLPEYNLKNSKVELSILGKVLDMNYAEILAKNKDLSLSDIMLLDKVQKRKRISNQEIKILKSNRLIEGRKPNFYLSKQVAQRTGQKARYSVVKGFDKQYYKDLIVKAIKEHGSMSRSDIDDLLWEKLPNSLNEDQKKNKVMNLLSEMRRKGKIKNIGSMTKSQWVLIS
ncbi:RNA-binding domain-containing protein [Membranihabitans maritimus]|uniref:RNA-binding domain-containing protein n=1 Tax=Membranihabitans maritimus TaxID=2904244 RepID=UPI001F30EB9C|nr:RNA-binding domain-containing protein [Membranihabitans maritimus]